MSKTNEQTAIERLPLTNDYVFKRVFTKEGNESMLKDLLEAILEIKIEKVEVKNPEIPKETIQDKLSILDIKAQIDENTIVDIEMQMNDEKNIEHRSTVYMSKNIAGQLQVSDRYDTLKKSIVINFLNFNYYKRNSYHHIAKMRFDKAQKEKLVELGYTVEDEIATEDLEMHFIELQKFKKKNPKVESKLEQWIWTLIGEGEKIKMAEEKNEEIKKAVEVIDQMSMNPRERELYEARLKGLFNYNCAIHTAREEGKAEGKIDGQQAEKIKIAKKMLKEKIDIVIIERITGLSKEEIKKLKA